MNITMTFKTALRKIFRSFHRIRAIWNRTRELLSPRREFFRFSPVEFLASYIRYFRDYRGLQKLDENQTLGAVKWFPCLSDNTSHTPVDPIYFLQDTWAVRKIVELHPDRHVDIGSSVKTIGILSQLLPVTMVDIRPIDIELPGLDFIEGSAENLPFEDSSIDSLSSLCVIEHIGLGRYGDRLDPFGHEKAIREFRRVLRPGGTIFFSVPVDRENRLYFNAHRAFTRARVLELMSGFTLVEERYQYRKELHNHYDPEKGFGTGLFQMSKQSDVH